MLRNTLQSNRPRTARWLAWGVALSLSAVGLAPTAVRAQTGGTITGQVNDADSGRPVSGARVVVTGTSRVTVSDAAGTFRIPGVSAGTRQVQVSAMGFRAQMRSVAVAAGQDARLEVRLQPSAIALDELVVSSQATSTARREIGTSIASIDVSALENAPVTSVSDLLQSRTPGVTVLSSSGNPGAGSNILLRGPTSLSQGIQPVIYVDGVRMDTKTFSSDISGASGAGGQGWSAIDDLNPADIDRIEVIKGAAAATLYGTEASAGVIQIFTKQGRGNRQAWTSTTDLGISRSPESDWNISAYSDWFHDRFVRNGTNLSQSLALRGTVDNFRYSLSGTVGKRAGVFQGSGSDNASYRVNLGFTPSEKFNLTLNSGYARRDVESPQGATQYGAAYNGLAGGARGIQTPAVAFGAIDILDRLSRFTASASVEFVPRAGITQRVTLGADVAGQDITDILPFGSPDPLTFFRKYNYRRANNTFNLDYAGTIEFRPTSWMKSRTALGFQAYSNSENWIRVTGSGFPGPVTTVDAVSARSGDELRTETKGAGFFVEEQVGLNEQLFVTAGLRADGHSAFGEDHSYEVYPKADASYIVSDHEFWPEALGTLRLRAAYGTAGKQPPTFSSLKTWRPVPTLGGVPGFTTGAIGNSALAPEVSREIEGGFDLGLLGERLNVEFTFYNQRTRDALYAVNPPPSQGFIQSQLVNVGEITNRGTELAVRGRLLQSDRVDWNARISFSTNENEVASLGSAAPTTISAGIASVGHPSLQQIRQGYAIGSFFGDRLIEKDGQVGLASQLLRLPDGTLPEGWDFLGVPFPKRTFALGSDATLWKNLTLGFLLDYKGGHHLQSHTTRLLSNLLTQQGDTALGIQPGQRVANWCRGEITDVQTRGMCEYSSVVAPGNHVHRADNWHLRELSVAYRLPTAMTRRMRTGSTTIGLAGRNLWRSQDYVGLDAEASYSLFSPVAKQTYFDVPLPRELVAKITVQF